jgi:tetratricopeptide (TPR) repeat protein
MIVKDEEQTIGRCLESVRGLINTWTIVDTGSTDRTQEVIRAALAGIPGALHERPWRNFGHNRTELMELARHTADYLLLLDADHTVEVGGPLPDLSADAYTVLHDGDPAYRIKRLVRGDRAWRFVGSTHEYIQTDGPETVADLDALRIVHHADGGARHDKFARDARLLDADLERDPGDARAVFYLAQTRRDMGDLDQAIELYERRATMAGWEEETFYARFQVGVLRATSGDWPAAVASLLQAWSLRPQRAEPLYELASGFRQREQYAAAHLFAERALRIPLPADHLFVHPWVYAWGVRFEYSVAAYWAGDVHGALRACDALLERDDLPAVYREHTERNREHCLEALGARA